MKALKSSFTASMKKVAGKAANASKHCAIFYFEVTLEDDDEEAESGEPKHWFAMMVGAQSQHGRFAAKELWCLLDPLETGPLAPKADVGFRGLRLSMSRQPFIQHEGQTLRDPFARQGAGQLKHIYAGC